MTVEWDLPISDANNASYQLVWAAITILPAFPSGQLPGAQDQLVLLSIPLGHLLAMVTSYHHKGNT